MGEHLSKALFRADDTDGYEEIKRCSQNFIVSAMARELGPLGMPKAFNAEILASMSAFVKFDHKKGAYVNLKKKLSGTKHQEKLYIVQPGDTVNRIAVRFGVSEDDIVRYNSIPNRATIKPGQQITVPMPPAKGCSIFGGSAVFKKLLKQLKPMLTKATAASQNNRSQWCQTGCFRKQSKYEVQAQNSDGDTNAG